MTTVVEVPRSESGSEKNWLRTRISEDMRKITSAAAKLRIHRKKKEEKKQLKQQEQNNAVEEKTVPQIERTEKPLPTIPSGTQILPNQRSVAPSTVRTVVGEYAISTVAVSVVYHFLDSIYILATKSARLKAYSSLFSSG